MNTISLPSTDPNPQDNYLLMSLTQTARRLSSTQRGPDGTISTNLSVKVRVLLDTGATSSNYISSRIISDPADNTTQMVCNGVDGKCKYTLGSVSFNLIAFSDVTHKYEEITIEASILDESPIDVIIGRPSIKQWNLARLFPEHFFNCSTESVQHTGPPVMFGSETVLHTIMPTRLVAQTSAAIAGVASCGSECQYGAHRRGTGCGGHPLESTKCHFLSTIEVSKTDLLDHLADDDEIDHDRMDAFAPWLVEENSPSVNDTGDLLDLIRLEGTPAFQRQLRAICEEFRMVFDNKLPPQPALVTPFKLVVNDLQWRVPRNRAPPRVQTPAKQIIIHQQIGELLKQGIIKTSNAAFYSQVLLIPKPGGEWRFCIDYRALNDCTEANSWPLPNIKLLFSRLGQHQSVYYGVMDNTQGYHQAPVELGSTVYLAFIAFCGIYEYTRLPFGPKRAPSYYQEMMATIVLAGLIYFICEVYLDDIIVHAKTEEEFLQRLRTVLSALQKHNIILKPSKCRLGFKKLEYVGREISHDGLTMSEAKIRKVLDFPKPEFAMQLKQFLGLANYFRDFMDEHSTVVRALHNLIPDYKRANKLIWTEEATTSWTLIKAMIEKCPTLAFLNNHDPVTLATDASDYGIGGFLSQTINGVKHPIAFVSKSLTATQLKWSVLQKEAYGIFFCCKELEYLLRDRFFTIETDHRNLTFMNTDSNPMVTRWKLAQQELNFNIKYLKGSENIISDPFSRLCKNFMKEDPLGYSEADVLATMLQDIPQIDDYLNAHISTRMAPHILALITPKLGTIPRDKYDIISKVHNSTAGHHGVERTIHYLTLQEHKWQFLRMHVRQFIAQCPCCQKMSQLTVPIITHRFTTSTYWPMECLNIDFIGPYPDGGYIMVIVDCFSRWVELYHSHEATSSVAAFNLLHHFGRFGAPCKIRSDRGSHFANSLITDFLKLVGVEHCLTLAYSSQENAIVERQNKEINRHITALTFHRDTANDYKSLLPFVQRIMNSSLNTRLRASPAQLLFGNAIHLDRGVLLPQVERPLDTDPISTEMARMLALQDNLIKIAQTTLIIADEEHMAEYTQAHTEFQSESYVLVRYRGSLNNAPPSRILTKWKGPMRVIRNSGSEYTLYDLIRHKEYKYHVKDIKQFIFDPLLVDPLQVAAKDYEEYFIDHVIKHIGNPKRLTSLEFYVHWTGYDESEDSWVPWKNIRETEALHIYLRKMNLQKLIPKRFH